MSQQDRELTEQERVAILESDEAFAVWAGKRPLVRAGTYGNNTDYGKRIGENSTIRINMAELEDFRRSAFHDDPRRPVVMRGAFYVMQSRYSAKSDYALEIIERYLRRIRFTSIDPAEIGSIWRALLGRVPSYVAPRIKNEYQYGYRSICYIDGEVKHIDGYKLRESQKGLYRLVQKLEALERKYGGPIPLDLPEASSIG